VNTEASPITLTETDLSDLIALVESDPVSEKPELLSEADYVTLPVEPDLLSLGLKRYLDGVPLQRTAGADDLPGTGRGNGDLYAYILADTYHNYATTSQKQIGTLRVSGRGDDSVDSQMWDACTGKSIRINLKCSDARPGDKMHLYVKAEELLPEKLKPDVFVMAFMRIGRVDPRDPRRMLRDLVPDGNGGLRDRGPNDYSIVLVGWCFFEDRVPEHLVGRFPKRMPWASRAECVIPELNHPGIGIEVGQLWPMRALFEITQNHTSSFRR
jgi:hypothetical protein